MEEKIKTYKSGGYIHLSTKRYHRWIMEQYLGRPLKEEELIHHINGNKTDNRIENLQIVSRSEHTKIHKTWEKVDDKAIKKMKESKKGKGYGKDNAFFGKYHTLETRIKMSEAKIGKKTRPCSEERKRKISEANKNRPSNRKGLTLEQIYGFDKAKIRRERFTKSRKGISFLTEESKKKISDSLKKYFANKKSMNISE